MPLTITDGALPWQRLAVRNVHPRDERIAFREEDHTYAIDGDRTGWISCTTFIGQFYEHFDPDAVIRKMMMSSRWKESKYYGMKPDEIKKQWNDNGTEASEAGTKMHLDIEHYNNADPVGNLAGDEWEPTEGSEWSYFLAYDRKHRRARGWVPFRTEWLVFKEDIKLAGSIDMVYMKPDGTLAIYDWKRAKNIAYENKYQKMYPPISHLPDTNYWHYSLQLNIYRRILQEHYDVKVTELALVVLHPNQTSYEVIQLNMMDDEVEAMFQARRVRMLAAATEVSTDGDKTNYAVAIEDEASSKRMVIQEDD
jgi:hypothetical protein